MLWLEILLMIAVCTIGVLGYVIGKSRGNEDGFDRGLQVGRRQGREQYIRALEARRTGPDGHDALLRVLPDAGENR